MRMSLVAAVLILIFGGLACWYVMTQTEGGVDITGVKQDAVNYCKLVHAGAWPDYDHVYKKQCRKDGTVNWEYVYSH